MKTLSYYKIPHEETAECGCWRNESRETESPPQIPEWASMDPLTRPAGQKGLKGVFSVSQGPDTPHPHPDHQEHQSHVIGRHTQLPGLLQEWAASPGPRHSNLGGTGG